FSSFATSDVFPSSVSSRTSTHSRRSIRRPRNPSGTTGRRRRSAGPRWSRDPRHPVATGCADWELPVRAAVHARHPGAPVSGAVVARAPARICSHAFTIACARHDIHGTCLAVPLRNSAMANEGEYRTHIMDGAERRFRDLVHGVDAIVWEADAASLACTFGSQRAEELVGYRIERWLGAPDFGGEFLDARDRDRVLAHYAEALTADRPLEHEFRANTADRRQVWLRDRVHPAEHGRVRGLMIDVTEHKRLEQERDELLLREQVARNEMETAAEIVQRLETITEAALSDLSEERLLRRVLERIRDVLEADNTLLLLPTDDGRQLRLVAAVGVEVDEDVRIPIAE